MSAQDNPTLEKTYFVVTDSPCPRAQIVESAFRRSSYAALRNIHCRIVDGVLTLRGEVPTYFLKQLAQSLAAKAADVNRVVNLVQVADADLSLAVRNWRHDAAERIDPGYELR